MTIGEALHYGFAQLRETSTTPELDTEILLAYSLGRGAHSNDVFVLTHREHVLDVTQKNTFTNFIRSRRAGVPIAYMTHVKEFYGREFFIDERVLVPRPETELMIDAVKKHALEHGIVHPRILDIGTGSGCIAITLTLELPDIHVTATDISADALQVASENAKKLDAPRIRFARGDLFNALNAQSGPSTPQQFDYIVSNPPYIDMSSVDTASPHSNALPHEPQNALTPADKPAIDTIARILRDGPQWLALHGALFIEIGHDQGAEARQLATLAFPMARVTIEKDLAGFDRVLSVVKN